jgi:choline-sulfatase
MLATIAAVIGVGCDRSLPPVSPAREPKPSILLITLDTTRADAIGPEAAGVETPGFNAIAARGQRFRQAYATVPETLPSHSSIMTGLYPGGHGVHQNARYLPGSFPVLAERLQQAGYRTSAFVSSFVLARRFGLGRGFDLYDDEQPAGKSERAARETTDVALAELRRPAGKPHFMWVHYYDPHAPFAPPEPFRARYAADPYLGEVAAMDEQIGRLAAAFERDAQAPVAIVIVADHGEGLGDHGEAGHGHLLYQSTMRVPFVLMGPGVTPGVTEVPVSTRRIFHTILDWAGLGREHSLRGAHEEVVLAEGMKPFLEYGWLPQVMGVSGRHKAILAGTLEAYDVVADPAEARDLGSGAALPAGLRKAIEEYPVPVPGGANASGALDDEAKRRLASLGYVGGGAAPVVRKNAPRPADMTGLFPVIERAGALFVARQYAAAIPHLQLVLARDPYNLDAALRVATAHSSLGQDAKAVEMFTKAAAIAPGSQDVRTYLALHYARGKDWERAVPLLEQIVAETPERLTAVEALARLRARQGQAAMNVGKTAEALAAFERARTLNPTAFTNDLELGVLYLAVRRFPDARAALDRALAVRPDDAMALFKRAQVSVLLNEPEKLERITAARMRADATTKPLIERERLFK